MDDSMVDSVFDDIDASSDFDPEPQPVKAKAPPKKATATASKSKAAPKKPTQTTLKPAKAAPKKRPKPVSDDENSDQDSRDDDSLLSNNTPPSAKRQKKAAPAKKPAGKPLQPVENESFTFDAAPDAKPAKGSSNEQYQRLTHLEHIIKRPDTYIGSVERTQDKMWVYNSQTESMECRDVSFVPGLYKIFDEILVNAADNKQRDKNMSEIRVHIDREKGMISVENDGRGIPIEIHAKDKIYIPEMIFGHLLTSSNYDDNEMKVTGGRNGFGAKLCNVFSTKFTLETVDSKQKKKYTQTWTDNMSKMGTAKITPAKGDDYTRVTFWPDFHKFGMDEIDEDFEALVMRRTYDMAGTNKDLKVYLNGNRIKVRGFKQYMAMYTKAITAENALPEDAPAKEAQTIVVDNPHERWEIGFAVSDGSFQQVSFVNSIATSSGGTHVNYIADQIVTKLTDIVKKKNKGGVALKPAQIKNHIFLFVNAQIVNPAFTSQTKEQLTTKASQFGSKPTVSDKFLNALAKTEVIENILHFAQRKADQVMKKSDGNRRTRMNHSKLTDANKAGTRDGWQCTLILTEGDSASLLALAGRAVVDPDRIGVFPLRGKLLNVRDASVDQISKNQEIQNIKKFMGLQHKKVYEDTRSLRYGHLMIMTDQDHDGSHIKGLLINFLECSFPSLLRIPGFLKVFITPIVKVWKGDPKHPKKPQSFFTMPEYEAWKTEPGNQRGWDHKYYKGLGTSNTSDAETYFRDLDRHLKDFSTIKPEEPALIDMAFSKKKADARKEWLRQFRPGTFLDMRIPEITYDDFINKELILFSMADNHRSIPSVVDGLKPGQRKVLYTCFRRNLKKDQKVFELAGSVSQLTAYAYGDASMQQTIVGLAQTFVGSNNVNCLEPSGNFGSRLQGGADCASARYIYTRLTPFARKIFHTQDEPLLTYNEDDGKNIEPEMYVPVVPMVLINGADGIGTGWSSSIPNYNPEDVVENLKRRMAGSSKEDMLPMKPWFRDWSGEVEDIGGDRFKFSGTIRQTGDHEIEITELPIRVWTQDFKDKLEDILKAEKTPSFIKDYVEYNTPTKVHFIIKMDDKHMQAAIERGLEDTFKLSKTMATTNLVAFDPQGRIHKYATVNDIMEEFYLVRLKFYEHRKRHMMGEMELDLDKMNNQARFIQMIIDNKLVVSKKKKQVIVAELRDKDFKPIPKVADAHKQGEDEPVVDANEDAEEVEENASTGATDFDYLLGMAIWSLTQERIDKLRKQIGDKETEYKKLAGTSPKQLWTGDLDDFINEWRIQLDDEAKRAKKSASQGRRASTKLRIGGKVANKKRKGGDDTSDDDWDSKPKSKKVANDGKPKPSSIFSWLDNKGPPKAVPASKTLASTFEQRSATPMDLDAASQEPDASNAVVAASKTSAPASKAPKAAVARPPSKKAIVLDDDDDDDDVFSAVAKEVQAKSTLARQPRRNASKPVKYTQNSSDMDESEDENGDDLLGDVSNMVRGLPGTSANGNGQSANSKTLFTESVARPSSSSSAGGRGLSASRPSAGINRDLSDGNDETDYASLVPKGSPEKPAARSAREYGLTDMDDEDDFAPAPKATKPAASKPAAKAKKAAAPAGASAAEKEPVTLSPAAKAYAKKLQASKAATGKSAAPQPKPAAKAKTDTKKPAAKKAKKAVDSDLEEDDGIGALSSDEDEEPVVKAAARPSRRAAAGKARSKYTVDEDDSLMMLDDDESEADYDDDDDD